MNSSFKGTATFRANNFARKGISVLIFTVALFDAFFLCSLIENDIYSFKIFMANNCLMMVFY